jgi:hypothetical protein
VLVQTTAGDSTLGPASFVVQAVRCGFSCGAHRRVCNAGKWFAKSLASYIQLIQTVKGLIRQATRFNQARLSQKLFYFSGLRAVAHETVLLNFHPELSRISPQKFHRKEEFPLSSIIRGLCPKSGSRVML